MSPRSTSNDHQEVPAEQRERADYALPRRKRVYRPAGISVEALAESWFRVLAARNLRPKTIRVYRYALRNLVLWGRAPSDGGEPLAVDDVGLMTTEGLERFMTAGQSTHAAGTVFQWFGVLKMFFGWAVQEEEIAFHPMTGMQAPKVDEKPPEMLSTDDLLAILKTCEGKSFWDRRDRAIFLVLIDTGMRSEELVNIRLDDVDLKQQTIQIMGKGRRGRVVPFAAQAATALDRYILARRRYVAEHPQLADEPHLWLSRRVQALGLKSLPFIVARRAQQAGVKGAHPHLFRHGFAHAWRLSGGNSDDLALIAGWRPNSPMLARYGASAAAERARRAHERLSPADHLHQRKERDKDERSLR